MKIENLLDIVPSTLRKTQKRSAPVEAINYFNSPIDKMEKPDFDNMIESKGFRLLVDGELDDERCGLLTSVLMELSNLQYVLYHSPREEEEYITKSEIKTRNFFIGEKFSNDNRIDFVKPWNPAYRIAAWVIGKKRDSEELLLNTWKKTTRIFHALDSHMFLGDELNEKQRFVLLFSESGVDNSRDIDYKNNEYNTRKGIQWGEKLNTTIINLGSVDGVKKFISLIEVLKDEQKEDE